MTIHAHGKLQPLRRPLTATERRLIRSKIRSTTARSGRASRVSFPITAGIIFMLWLWTVLASDAPWLIVTAFWVVAGTALALWVHRDMRKHAGTFDRMTSDLESALRRNMAEVYDIRSRSFAAFEELEDEGACYAFELDGNRLVFITGQEFYEGAKFPSLDFSLVYVLDEGGATVDMFIDKRAAKTPPARTIPAAVKQARDVPDHLEVRTGTIEHLEEALTSTST